MLVVAVVMGTMLLATGAGVAWAATLISCDFLGERNPGECAGTRKNDLISGQPGNDQVKPRQVTTRYMAVVAAGVE